MRKASSTDGAKAWLVDAMERVYPDRVPVSDPGAARLTAAAGGTAALVVAVRTARPGRVKVSFEGYDRKPAGWPGPAVFVLHAMQCKQNSVKICKSGPWNPSQARFLLRPAPFRVHEAMWPGDEVETKGHETLAFLLMWDLPRNVAAGAGRFTVRVTGPELDRTMPGSLSVLRVDRPAVQQLKVTNWFRLDRALNPYPKVKLWSEEHWRMVEEGLRLLRAGGQNTIMVPFADNGGNLVDVFKVPGGKYRFDFSRMDRFVSLAKRLGFRYFEGGHVGRKKDLESPFVHIPVPKPGGMEMRPLLSAESAAGKHYLRCFFTALRDHLAEKGWKKNWYQHVADEPFRAVAESFCRVCDFIREVWPEVVLIDAASGHAASEALDIPVPEIDYVEPYRDYFRRLGERGKEVWFYTCCCPVGAWPNRFLDFHLNKGSLLPWFNFHYRMPGFLHWGANQWGKVDLYEDTGFQGDGFILCPGPEGPVASVRWLALKIGIEDYELLAALEAAGGAKAKAARALCRSLIKGPTRFDYAVASVRNARRRLRLLASGRG